MVDKTDKNAGDAPPAKQEQKGRSKVKMQTVVEEEPPKTPSELILEERLRKAEERKNRFKHRWPVITKPPLNTRPWRPPGPPRRQPPIKLELPSLTLRRWVPPYRRRRRRRPRMLRIPPEEINKELYECAKLKKIWHHFAQVDKNKMMLQGTLACNSKRYRCGVGSGAQTACIAFVCRGLLNDKAPSELTRQDVDDIIDAGDKFYHQCRLALKCYKGKPQLELKQLLTSYFFKDHKYTVKIQEKERGILAKHPDFAQQAPPDLMALMEKRIGTTYMSIMTVGDRNFLIWGHPPPPEAGSQCRTVCYIFDPHMQSETGMPHKLQGGGAFLRYAGVTSFVLDFVANYGGLDASKRECPMPEVVLTDIEVLARDPLLREPRYELDLKALPAHCEAEWMCMNNNALIERKRAGEFPLQSLSAVSLATSRTTSRRKLREFYQKVPKEPAPTLPMAPEKGPAGPSLEHIMAARGEDFFLHCPMADAHTHGRDDMIPRPKSETMLHSMVDIANKHFRSQFQQLSGEKWILRATRHMASHRYQKFKVYTAIPCCLVALGMLRKLRARAWNDDILDETLDLGYNLYRDSMLPRGGLIRRLVLGEMAESFKIRETEFTHKDQGISVWGKLVSNNPKVFDLCRGLDEFFKFADTGILQIPGEYETAIWNEGGMYYLYHPWPADRNGKRVGLREGGKACLLCFKTITGLCEDFLASTRHMRRKPYSISAVNVIERPTLPPPIHHMKPVGPNRWVVRGSFHEGDARFHEEHRNKQATPTSIIAIAHAHLEPLDTWAPYRVDEVLVGGDMLYETTMEHLERMGINLEPGPTEEEVEGEGEEIPKGTLSAADVFNKHRVYDPDSYVETEVQDSAFVGSLTPTKGVMSLRQALKKLFTETEHAVLTARGASFALMRHNHKFYLFDPHGCDEKGYPSDDARAAACLICVGSNLNHLADAIESNLPPGVDDSFNLSPVDVTTARMDLELGAPEPKIESNAFIWIKKFSAAYMPGPRAEHTAVGKCATKAGIGNDDKAGRTLALPAVAAFAAATEAVPPSHMHMDHMFNFLEAGTEYYLQHVKKTGHKEITVEDLKEKFEMGVNTFSIELQETPRLPLRLPDEPTGEGAEGGGGEEPGEHEEVLKQIKELMTKMWNDQTKPTQAALLLGDYHQLGVWWSAGGQVVVFDPAPTNPRLMLTEHRIQKGDELRLQRIKDEMAGEGGGGGDEEEPGAEGEQQPEPEPTPVPRDATPVLMLFASPSEFIDKLTAQGPLDRKQCLAPYKLYPVKVVNELTSVLKDRRSPPKTGEDAVAEEEAEMLVEPLNEEAVGKYMTAVSRSIASVRGRVAQHESYFSEPARDNQDAAISVVAIAVAHIEPYVHWKPTLIDAVVKYGDRLHTMSLGRAKEPPRVAPTECLKEFRLTSFNVKATAGHGEDIVSGDLKAGEHGHVLNLRRGIARFFESHKYGVLCAKDYCVALWMGPDDKSVLMFDPHCVGPNGRTSPVGGAGLIIFSTLEDMADTYLANVEGLNRPGHNKFCITPITIAWEFAKLPGKVEPLSAVPDEGYECKVLTAYVAVGRGRTILRGSRPPDAHKFCRDAVLQSSGSAVVGVAMSHIRQPHLWTRNTVDQVMAEGCKLFTASINNLGYEFRPGDDVLMPLQVMKRFILGSNYVRVDMQEVYTGRLEQMKPTGATTLRSAFCDFFHRNTHGIVWCAPFATAVWTARGPAPACYMLEPHAASAQGLRTDGKDAGAACVLTFTSPKLMAHAYLQNIPPADRMKRNFHMYNISVLVAPIKKLTKDPPLVKSSPNMKLLPATSKVGVDGLKRRASEADRKHPPGGVTCKDAQRATVAHDKDDHALKGRRNANGWLVLQDGSQFLSARHSIACRNFPHGSRGHQALPCSVMAVAMSRVQDVCRWCSSTLDAVLLSGDQLYQDSYLHYRPKGTKILHMEQILRKFYTPGNCVCRVVVFQPRQHGVVNTNLSEQLTAFFREERYGVLVAGEGDFAVALFKTPRGFYMFDPADRDRYGRAVPPPCVGHARACFSQYPTVQALAAKLGANVPPVLKAPQEKEAAKPKEEPAKHKHAAGKHKDEAKHKQEPAKHQEAPAQHKEAPAQHKEAPAQHKEAPAQHKETPAQHKEAPAQHKEAPAQHKEAPAQHKEAPAQHKDDAAKHKEGEDSKVHFKEEPATFTIYGMEVTSLRRLNQFEK